MQALRDGARIATQRRQARWLTLIGAVLLIGVLISSFNFTTLPNEQVPIWIPLSYGALIVGFMCFNAGLQGIAKWSRRPRRDEIIDNHLKQLNDRFAIFHYPTLARRSYDHVIVHPGGVTLLIVRDNFGPVSYQNGRWRKGARIWARLFNFAGPSIGNPHGEATTQAAGLQEYLHGQGVTPEVDAVIVFVNPRVELTVDESAIPIRRIEDLSGLLREKSASAALAGGQRLRIVEVLKAGLAKPDDGTAKARKGKVRPRGRATSERPR